MLLTVSVTQSRAGDEDFEVPAAFPGQPPAADLSLSGALVPDVLTTTRLRQPKSRVPGTTTIIQGEMIRDLGITELVDIFRLVPGMTVGFVGNNEAVTSYHGTVAYDQRRLQVLVDGRTAYQPNFANVKWETMAVPIELIERIEVSRGPNSAAYGANAFLGTINIITRSPEDTGGSRIHGAAGSRGYAEAFAYTGTAGEPYNWRLAYQKRMSDGFDKQWPDRESDRIVPIHDGHNLNILNYDSVAHLSPDYSVEVRGGLVEGVDEKDRLRIGEDFGAVSDPDVLVDDYYLQTRLNGMFSDSHFYHLQVSYQDYRRRQLWRSCPPPEVIGLDPSMPAFCSDLNQDLDESRLEFEIQDSVMFSSWLRLVGGAGYRKDSYESETFFNGSGQSRQSTLFANLEYSPFQWLTFNLGGNWERTTTTDESYFSPRIAINFILADNHTLRFVFSKAVRTPDAFERKADWTYRPRNITPPDVYGEFEGQPLGPRARGYSLEEEHIISREISYFGQYQLGNGLLSTEIRYFYDHLRDLISGVTNIDDWNLGNKVATDQQGIELETTLTYPRTLLRLTYAYMDQQSEYSGPADAHTDRQKQILVNYETRLTARHSGSFAWIQQLPGQFSASAAYYLADEFMSGRFERLDARFAREVFASRASYEIAFIVQHYIDGSPGLSPKLLISDRNQFFLEGSVKF